MALSVVRIGSDAVIEVGHVGFGIVGIDCSCRKSRLRKSFVRLPEASYWLTAIWFLVLIALRACGVVGYSGIFIDAVTAMLPNRSHW